MIISCGACNSRRLSIPRMPPTAEIAYEKRNPTREGPRKTEHCVALFVNISTTYIAPLETATVSYRVVGSNTRLLPAANQVCHTTAQMAEAKYTFKYSQTLIRTMICQFSMLNGGPEADLSVAMAVSFFNADPSI